MITLLQRQRVEWVDIAKGIGIFLMVIGHTGIPKLASQWIYSFHMPLFFFLSGYFFTSGKYSLKALLQRKFETIIAPYFFFVLITWIGCELLQYALFPPHSLWEVIADGSKGALWFVYVLFFVEVVFWFLDKIQLYLKNNWFKHVFCLIAAIIGYEAYYSHFHLPYKLEVVGLALLFFDLGYLISGRKSCERKLNIWLLLILAIADVILAYYQVPRLDMAGNSYGMGVSTLLIALLGIFLIIQFSYKLDSIPKWIRTSIVYIGRNTIVIVGLSSLIYMSLKKLFEVYNVPNYIDLPIRHLLLWVILVAFIWFFNRYTPFLIGKYRRK